MKKLELTQDQMKRLNKELKENQEMVQKAVKLLQNKNSQCISFFNIAGASLNNITSILEENKKEKENKEAISE